MEFDDFYNNLSYDEKLLSEKLGLESSSGIKKLQHENNQLKRKIREDMRLKSIETFNPGPVREGCGIKEGGGGQIVIKSDNNDYEFISHRTLVMLIFILLIVCVVQYINQQSMMGNINEIMGILRSRTTPLSA